MFEPLTVSMVVINCFEMFFQMADYEDRFVINIHVSEHCYAYFIRHIENIFMARSYQLPFLHMFVKCLIIVLKEDNSVIMHWFVCTKVSVTKETICNVFNDMKSVKRVSLQLLRMLVFCNYVVILCYNPHGTLDFTGETSKPHFHKICRGVDTSKFKSINPNVINIFEIISFDIMKKFVKYICKYETNVWSIKLAYALKKGVFIHVGQERFCRNKSGVLASKIYRKFTTHRS